MHKIAGKNLCKITHKKHLTKTRQYGIMKFGTFSICEHIFIWTTMQVSYLWDIEQTFEQVSRETRTPVRLPERKSGWFASAATANRPPNRKGGRRQLSAPSIKEDSSWITRATTGTWTLDLVLTRHSLYQLSYGSILCRVLGTRHPTCWHSQAPQVVPQLWRPASKRYSVRKFLRWSSHFVSLTFYTYYTTDHWVCQGFFKIFFGYFSPLEGRLPS